MGLRLLFVLILPAALFAQEASHVERFTPAADKYRKAVQEADAVLALAPTDVEALRKRGVANLRLDRLQEAEADLRRALELDPDSAALISDLGFLLWRQGRLQPALERMRRAVELEPDHPGANFYLGRLLLLTGGDPAEAAAALEKALELNPAETEIRFDLLTAYRALGDLIKAGAQVQILQATYPAEDPRLLYAEGLIAADLGQMDLALSRFRRAQDADPELPGVGFDLGMALIRQQRWEEAAAALSEAAREQPGAVVIAHLHALSLFNAGRLAEAQREVARGIQLDSNYAPLFTLLGVMLAADGENRRAVSLFKRAALLAPQDFDAHFYLGRAHFALRELEEALVALNRAVQLNPRHKDARFFLATALESLGRGEEAAAEYRRLLADSPEDLEGNVGLGALLIKQGQPAEAVVLLERAAQIDARHFEARLALGRALAQTGRLEAALPHLDAAVQLSPESTEAHYQRALALRRLGRLGEAEQEFARVKQLNEQFRGSAMGMGPPEKKP